MSAINPQEPGVPGLLASIYWLQGKGDQAISQELKVAALRKDSVRLHELELLSQTYRRAGLHAAELEAAHLKERACPPAFDQQSVDACDEFSIARQYGLAGEKEKALYWLGRAAAHLPNNRSADMVTTVKVLPELDCLRSDPRFLALLHEMHLPQ
ncbi:MAG TPA: hypothetical protein VMG82_14300 [Candidatus Sulfotelmatobacter sp.]|nr:hypothetical protein [Candidatus Sulfotelmatobacter sp.]